MFKKLFGGDKKKAQEAAPQKNPQETMDHLGNQIDIVDKRLKKIEMDQKRHIQEALAKKKAGDIRGKHTHSK